MQDAIGRRERQRKLPFLLFFYTAKAMNRQRGFTMAELVAVMIIVAILAVFATSAFDRRGFDAAGYADEVRTQLAYARQVAVAARREVRATIDSAGISLAMCADFACTGGHSVSVASPQGEAAYSRATPSGVALASSSSSIIFDAQGTPNLAADATLVVTGGGSNTQIVVEAGTGYVH